MTSRPLLPVLSWEKKARKGLMDFWFQKQPKSLFRLSSGYVQTITDNHFKRSTAKSQHPVLKRGWVMVGMNRHSNRHTPRRKCKLRSKFWWLTNFAIRMTYRISLRSSSIWEPRHPLLKVFDYIMFAWGILEDFFRRIPVRNPIQTSQNQDQHWCNVWLKVFQNRDVTPQMYQNGSWDVKSGFSLSWERKKTLLQFVFSSRLRRASKKKGGCGNDPSAGSPTETLLRLHLPLNDEV